MLPRLASNLNAADPATPGDPPCRRPCRDHRHGSLRRPPADADTPDKRCHLSGSGSTSAESSRHTSRTRLHRSRKPAHPNIWRWSILIRLTCPLTAPELASRGVAGGGGLGVVDGLRGRRTTGTSRSAGWRCREGAAGTRRTARSVSPHGRGRHHNRPCRRAARGTAGDRGGSVARWDSEGRARHVHPADVPQRPVETADVAVPAALCEIVYEIPISRRQNQTLARRVLL